MIEQKNRYYLNIIQFCYRCFLFLKIRLFQKTEAQPDGKLNPIYDNR